MIDKTFHTPGALALRLGIPSGRIEVETVDGEETHVVLTSEDESLLEDARVELRERSGGHELVVEVERRRASFLGLDIRIGPVSISKSGLHLTVRCPHGADLNGYTASADIAARGRYGSADLKTASGDVFVDEVTGSASAKTASGDVHLARLGGHARFQTVSGDVTVNEAGDDVVAQLVSGDLRIDDARGSVTTKSVSGDQMLRAVERGEVGITSVSGDILVGIRQGSRMFVDANSVSGTMHSELDLSDAPPSGEGPMIELRAKTVSGDVRVVRAPAREQVSTS
ncbi:MAG TPA: DUF4097 family beta strand repeat-containing protein [Gaiellaceae bacterium]|jgi:DUF4097 and DUF4098 domain-containing protein YvlB